MKKYIGLFTKKRNIIWTLIAIIIVVIGTHKESLSLPPQPQWITVEGIVLKVSNNKLWLFNLQRKKQETYMLTDKTQIKPESLFPISVEKRNIKDILRKGYKILIKINPKNQTIAEILIKEVPQ